MKTITIKHALINALANLPATSNGTKIASIVESGEDAFDEYPVIRVIPLAVTNEINQEDRTLTRTTEFAVSIYLDLGAKGVPTAEIIDTLMEIEQLIDQAVFEDQEWIPNERGSQCLVQATTTSTIDITDSKTGTAVYCDIILPVAYITAI